jgi:hypothetical protein
LRERRRLMSDGIIPEPQWGNPTPSVNPDEWVEDDDDLEEEVEESDDWEEEEEFGFYID